MSDTADMKSKLPSFIPCTPRRQQANNPTGPRKVEQAFKAGIKYKPPRPLLNSSGVDWVFQPHQDLYKTIVPNLLLHYSQYKKHKVDKTYAPMYFYLGGAGTGKSRHGSEFASSLQEAIKLRTKYRHYGELAQRLKTAFVFHVSFENGSSLTDKEKSDPWNAIGVRMLAQLLGQPVRYVRSRYLAEPDVIFQLVATAEEVDLYDKFTGILVVDGIQNAFPTTNDGKKKDSNLYGFLNQIGDLGLMSREEGDPSIPRQTAFIMTCVTATYFGPANHFLAGSSRKRVYLPLNRLDAPTWQDGNSQVLDNNRGTRLLVKDVGGHARAIEVIADELAEYQDGTHPSITELAHAVYTELRRRYKDAISVMRHHLLPVVQCILSRQPICLLHSIPGSNLKWEHVIAPGLLWFERIETDSDSDSDYDYDYDALGYLEAPYVWLWMLARLIPQRNTEPLCQFLREWDFNDYKELLRLESGSGPSGNVTWQDFETFCCYFRILRSLGFEDGQEVMLKHLHSGCKKIRDDTNSIMVNRHLKYAEADHQYSTMATSAKDVVTKKSGTLGAEDQLSYVILNAPGASAGDIFLSIERPAWLTTTNERVRDKIVREVGQCKFVKQNLDQKTYDNERNKSAGPDDFFLLYTTTKTPDDLALPNLSGLVDESCWDSYFGPFAGRAFIASRVRRLPKGP